MQAITLMYHDVVEDSDHTLSGFPWPDAALYKLGPKLFDKHLRAIAGAVAERPVTVDQVEMQNLASLPPDATAGSRPWMITFDDGGVSAHTQIADKLEELGWRGHFFITAGYIGQHAFMTAAQIRDLRRRGHVIGSHSFSHPLRMAQCQDDELIREWQTSVEIISGILGEPVRIASVPGGQYAPKIAEAASLAGIEALFNSEPTTRRKQVGSCAVYGRYAIQRGASPLCAAQLATGTLSPRLRQLVFWNAKKVVKTVGGEFYLKLRRSWSEIGG